VGLTLDYEQDYDRLRACQQAMASVPIELQPEALLRWVYGASVSIAFDNRNMIFEALSRLEGLHEGPLTITAGSPEPGDLVLSANKLPDGEPFPERGRGWVEYQSREYHLMFQYKSSMPPYRVFSGSEEGYGNADAFLIHACEILLPELIAGMPREDGARITGIPPAEKVGNGRRPGFAKVEDYYFPPFVVLRPRRRASIRGGGCQVLPAESIEMLAEECQSHDHVKVQIIKDDCQDPAQRDWIRELMTDKGGACEVIELTDDLLHEEVFARLCLDANGILSLDLAPIAGNLVWDSSTCGLARAWHSAEMRALRARFLNRASKTS
jgi:hypothetical protein